MTTVTENPLAGTRLAWMAESAETAYARREAEEAAAEGEAARRAARRAGLDPAALLLAETKATAEGPSAGVAYACWFFGGFLSLHRFYLGRTGTAVLQLFLNLLLVGLVWTFIDLFLIRGMVRQDREAIVRRVADELVAFRDMAAGR